MRTEATRAPLAGELTFVGVVYGRHGRLLWCIPRISAVCIALWGELLVASIGDIGDDDDDAICYPRLSYVDTEQGNLNRRHHVERNQIEVSRSAVEVLLLLDAERYSAVREETQIECLWPLRSLGNCSYPYMAKPKTKTVGERPKCREYTTCPG